MKCLCHVSDLEFDLSDHILKFLYLKITPTEGSFIFFVVNLIPSYSLFIRKLKLFVSLAVLSD